MRVDLEVHNDFLLYKGFKIFCIKAGYERSGYPIETVYKAQRGFTKTQSSNLVKLFEDIDFLASKLQEEEMYEELKFERLHQDFLESLPLGFKEIHESLWQSHKNPTVISCQVRRWETLIVSFFFFFISYYCYSLLFVSGLSTSTRALYNPTHRSSANLCSSAISDTSLYFVVLSSNSSERVVV